MIVDHTYIEEQHVVQRYLLGTLDTDEEKEFEEHYLDCDECLKELCLAGSMHRGLRAVAAEETVRRLTAAAVAAGWWKRIGTAGRSAVTLSVLVLFCLPSVVLYQRNTRLQQRLAEPSVNTEVLDLSPVRSGEQPEPFLITRMPDTPYMLYVDVPPGHEQYRVRLSTADGDPVWSSEAAVPDRYGSLTVSFPAPFLETLAAGDYTLEACGLAPTGNEVCSASFVVRLQ